jgi:hypothetical protein
MLRTACSLRGPLARSATAAPAQLQQIRHLNIHEYQVRGSAARVSPCMCSARENKIIKSDVECNSSFCAGRRADGQVRSAGPAGHRVHDPGPGGRRRRDAQRRERRGGGEEPGARQTKAPSPPHLTIPSPLSVAGLGPKNKKHHFSKRHTPRRTAPHTSSFVFPTCNPVFIIHCTPSPRPRVTLCDRQVLAGGRGLGTFTSGLQGGVHIVPAGDARALSEKMLGQTLVTKQTGPGGKPVDTLLVAEVGLAVVV